MVQMKLETILIGTKKWALIQFGTIGKVLSYPTTRSYILGTYGGSGVLTYAFLKPIVDWIVEPLKQNTKS